MRGDSRVARGMDVVERRDLLLDGAWRSREALPARARADGAVGLRQLEAHPALTSGVFEELDVAVLDDLDVSCPRGRGSRGRGREDLAPAASSAARVASMSVDHETEVAVAVGRLRARRGRCDELVAHVHERHPGLRPRSSSSKIRPYHSRASSTCAPTSEAERG